MGNSIDKSLNSIKKILLVFAIVFGVACLISGILLFIIKQDLFLGFLYAFLPLCAVALFFDIIPLQIALNTRSIGEKKTDVLKKPMSYINSATLICIVGFLGIFISHGFGKAFFCGTSLAIFLFSFILLLFHLLLNHLSEILDYENDKAE